MHFLSLLFVYLRRIYKHFYCSENFGKRLQEICRHVSATVVEKLCLIISLVVFSSLAST